MAANMLEWVHCNRCYTLMSEVEQIPFYVTSCGHTFCGRCTDGSIKKCLIHNSDCSYALLSDLQKSHEVFFISPIVTFQKNLRTLEFQLTQFGSLIHYLKDKMNKYNAQKQEILAVKLEAKRHRDEKNELKQELIEKHEEVKRLKKQLEQSQRIANTQKPGMSNKHIDSQIGSGYLFGNISSGNNLSFSPMARNTNSQIFTPPKPVSFPKSYRENNAYIFATPQGKTVTNLSPTSPEYSQRTLRKVALPGDKGSSPINRIGLQRLNLKCTPSFERTRAMKPSHANAASKYNKYF